MNKCELWSIPSKEQCQVYVLGEQKMDSVALVSRVNAVLAQYFYAPQFSGLHKLRLHLFYPGKKGEEEAIFTKYHAPIAGPAQKKHSTRENAGKIPV